ncbi:predicted protein [Nematostella vectensis]|uniref:FP protein C-terminal domain-containing protein n=1 Tax=Nematostella vectensis TaxID=45351 RepID=A7RGI2_NEMVE|nr:predicted protein [Nematostella vectensis]|eukprot:XP_001641591.1 predicted protein [Nematostella vectensis]
MASDHIEDLLDRKFDEKLRPMKSSLKDLSSQLAEAVNSLAFLHDQCDILSKKVKFLESRNTSLETENKLIKVELNKMAGDLNTKKKSLDDIEQYSRRDCLEIKGVPRPAKPGVHVNTPTASIIVKFARRDVRDRFYAGRKHLRDKSVRDTRTDNKIYISESLSPGNRELFKAALSARHDLKFKYIWTQNRKVFLRKNNDSQAVLISKSQDLLHLKQREDHDSQEVESANLTGTFKLFCRVYSHYDESAVVHDMQAINWEHCFSHCKDVNDYFDSFYASVERIIDKHAPLKKLSRKEIKFLSKPWITTGIKHSIAIKNKLYKQFLNTQNSFIHNKF